MLEGCTVLEGCVCVIVIEYFDNLLRWKFPTLKLKLLDIRRLLIYPLFHETADQF